jgi:hypothetical protein
MKRILLLWVVTIALCFAANAWLPPHGWKFFWLVPTPLTPRVVWDGLTTLFIFQPGVGVQITLLLVAVLTTVGWLV